MIECWLTVQVDFQRTMDVRVTGSDYADVAERYKEKDGLKVIAVRPCHRLEEADV
jgi:hypothetical protein